MVGSVGKRHERLAPGEMGVVIGGGLCGECGLRPGLPGRILRRDASAAAAAACWLTRIACCSSQLCLNNESRRRTKQQMIIIKTPAPMASHVKI